MVPPLWIFPKQSAVMHQNELLSTRSHFNLQGVDHVLGMPSALEEEDSLQTNKPESLAKKGGFFFSGQHLTIK